MTDTERDFNDGFQFAESSSRVARAAQTFRLLTELSDSGLARVMATASSAGHSSD